MLDPIPGRVSRPGIVIRYLESVDERSFLIRFKKMLGYGGDLPAKAGAVSRNCSLTLPDGRTFFGFQFQGDLEKIEANLIRLASDEHLSVGKIQHDSLVIEGEAATPLEQCVFRRW